MNCKEIRKNYIISRYIDGTLPPTEVDDFTIHCLHCGTCYQALTKEEKLIDFFRSGHGHEHPKLAPVKNRFSVSLCHLAWAGAVLAVIGVVVLFILTNKHINQTRIFAFYEIEVPHYEASLIRSASCTTTFCIQFKTAMEHYLKAEYKAAADSLQHAIEFSPQNYQALFFLGVSRLLSGQTEEAVTELKKITVLPANAYTEETYWYLGKAYLKMGKTSAAKEQFTLVLKMGKNYSQRAKEILTALK